MEDSWIRAQLIHFYQSILQIDELQLQKSKLDFDLVPTVTQVR
jgi:hypothetical protein